MGYLVLGHKCFLLDDGVLSECHPPRWKHAFDCIFSFGLIPMGYAFFFSLVSVLLWSSFSLWVGGGFRLILAHHMS